MKTTNNLLKHKDYQPPQGMWHFCISDKNYFVYLQLRFNRLFGVPIEQLNPME
jgi:hypothetical protein